MNLVTPVQPARGTAASDTASTAVEVKDLAIRYGSLDVLRSMNLAIARGEFLVLLGPSGCGKSTLLNAIAGLLDISDGEIWISGRNVTWAEPAERGIGMVFQSYALYPRMTVAENLSFGLRMTKTPRAEIDRRVASAAKLLQLEPLLKRRPGELSGGQRQRVAIGRALVREVDVFLFDEPLSNLDAKLRAELRVEIKKLHQELGNTMIYVTHDQIEAMTLADRIAVMRGGVVQQLDAPAEVYARPRNLFVAGFIGSPAMNFVDGSLRAAATGARFEAGSLQVPLDRYRFVGAPTDTSATLGVRPEHVSIRPGEHPFETEGLVEVVEPMGADTLVWTRLADRPFSIRTDGERRFAVGEPIRFSFDLARASLFDTASGERV